MAATSYCPGHGQLLTRAAAIGLALLTLLSAAHGITIVESSPDSPPYFIPISPAISSLAPPNMMNVTNDILINGAGAVYDKSPHLPSRFFPFPTNRWWAIWTQASAVSHTVGVDQVEMHPWRAKSLPHGIEAVPPGNPCNVKTTYIVPIYNNNLTVTAVEGLTDRTTLAANEMGVTFQWRAGNGGAGSMRAALLQGDPFLTVIYAGVTPTVLQPLEAQINEGLGEKNGTAFVVFTDAGMMYKYYFSSPVTVSVTPSALTLTAPFTGVMRIALLYSALTPIIAASNASLTEQLYDANVDVYPIAAVITPGYQPAPNTGAPERGIVRITFITASMSGAPYGQGQLMMMAMTHHRAHLAYPSQPGPADPRVRMDGIHGELAHVLGSDWYLVYDLPDIAWNSPHGISDPAKLQTVIDTLLADAANWPPQDGVRPDPYFGSSDLAAIGRMAVIADELAAASPANAAALTGAATSLRTRLAALLDGRLASNPRVGASLVYDTTWGGLITYDDAVNHEDNNYGNSNYNDHHFQYGYLLYAAAALAKGNQTWLASQAEALVAVVRDYANPNQADPWFPYARMMDWWGGHSWAAGVFTLADGKDQESSSEAVHSYYAVSLLGRVLDNPDLTRWGQLLAAVEISGAQTYWHMPSSSTVYPAPFNAQRVVGVLWSGKLDYLTYFGDNPAFVHGIQYIPFTPISEALLRPDWAQESVAVASTGLSAPIPPAWAQFVAMAQATYDPQSAWETVAAVSDPSAFFGGWASHPKSVELYWIASRSGVAAGGAGRRSLAEERSSGSDDGRTRCTASGSVSSGQSGRRRLQRMHRRLGAN